MRKMNKLKISAAIQQIIMADIFGKRRVLLTLMTKMSLYGIYSNFIQSGTPSLDLMTSKYFDKCIKQDMIEGMLLPVRKSAGYGANFFYFNPVESVHSKFKNRIQRVKADKEISGKPERLCSFIEAAQLYHDLLKEHWRNITRCTINEGPYELSPNFKRLCIPVDVWLTMDIHKKVKKLRKIGFIPSTLTDDISTYNNDANNSNNVNSDSVMPDFEASGLPSPYKTNWDGAKYYVQNAETTVQESTLLRNVYHIKSRSSPDKIILSGCNRTIG